MWNANFYQGDVYIEATETIIVKKVAQKAILIHNNSKSVTINKPKAKTVVCKKSDKSVVTTTSKKTVGISKCQ